MAPSLSEKVCHLFRYATFLKLTPLQFSLAPDPVYWGSTLHDAEPDDWLHNPDPRRDKDFDAGGTIFTARGLANLGCIAILALGLVGLLFVLAIAHLHKD